MVEIPITIVNADLVESYKSNGQIIYPYVSFSPHSVTGTPTQACPASYKTHPVNTVKVDNDNFQYEVEIPTGLNPFQVKSIFLFDQNDQLIGYTTADIPYLGSAKLSVRLLINYTGWPGADPWENMQQMVQNEVNVLETWKANAEDIQNGIPRLWNKAIYVDVVNGDDENDGSQSNPVKTLKHAIEDMVPVGGYAILYLVDGTYKLTSDITLKNKLVWMQGNGDSTILTTETRAGVGLFWRFVVKKAILIFNNLKIVIPDMNETAIDVCGLVYAYSDGISTQFKSVSIEGPAVWNGGANLPALAIADGWGSSFMGVNLQGTTVTTNSNLYVVRAKNGNVLYTETGVTIDNSNMRVTGIIRDANGTPRNVISNIVL